MTLYNHHLTSQCQFTGSLKQSDQSQRHLYTAITHLNCDTSLDSTTEYQIFLICPRCSQQGLTTVASQSGWEQNLAHIARTWLVFSRVLLSDLGHSLVSAVCINLEGKMQPPQFKLAYWDTLFHEWPFLMVWQNFCYLIAIKFMQINSLLYLKYSTFMLGNITKMKSLKVK